MIEFLEGQANLTASRELPLEPDAGNTAQKAKSALRDTFCDQPEPLTEMEYTSALEPLGRHPAWAASIAEKQYQDWLARKRAEISTQYGSQNRMPCSIILQALSMES